MSKEKSTANIWLVIGVVVLIALLLIWLTVADFFGDTDVAALVSPLVSTFSIASALMEGAGESEVAASSFFMIEKMKMADRAQRAMSMPQMAATEILPHSSMGMDTR